MRGESGRRSGRFGESSGVVFVTYDCVEGGESDGFAAAVRGAGGFETQLGHGGDGEVVIGAGEGLVGCFLTGTLDAVYVGLWRRLGLFEVEGEITRIWERFRCRQRLGYVAQLFRSLEIVSTGLCSHPLACRSPTRCTCVILIVGFPPFALTKSSGSYSVLPCLVATTSTPASLANSRTFLSLSFA